MGTTYDKVLSGVITAVDEINNMVNVRVPEVSDEFRVAISFPFVSFSSGIRFLPRVNDTVLIGFTPQYEPKMLGFENKLNVHQGNSDLAQSGVNLYRKLSPGELVLYGGSGASEIFLSNTGVVNISSGVNVINLDNLRRMIESTCGTFSVQTLPGASMRMGYCVRTLVPGQLETGVPGITEVNIGVNGLTGKIFEFKAGTAVIDDLGLPEVNPLGFPKQFSFKVLAGLIPIGEIYGGLDSVGIDAPIIRLGGLLAVNHVALGEPLAVLLNSLLAQLITLCGAVEAKSGQSATITAVAAQITALLATVPTILSTKVVAE